MGAIPTNKLTLEVDGAEVAPAVLSATVASKAADNDTLTFATAAAGGARQYSIKLKIVQDPEAGSLWDQVWSHAGEEVDFTLRPFGNATPSPSQPHFTGTATITEPDGDLIGGDANASTSARFTSELEWVCLGKPTRVTA